MYFFVHIIVTGRGGPIGLHPPLETRYHPWGVGQRTGKQDDRQTGLQRINQKVKMGEFSGQGLSVLRIHQRPIGFRKGKCSGEWLHCLPVEGTSRGSRLGGGCCRTAQVRVSGTYSSSQRETDRELTARELHCKADR